MNNETNKILNGIFTAVVIIALVSIVNLIVSIAFFSKF
jgi:hypothetical protein